MNQGEKHIGKCHPAMMAERMKHLSSDKSGATVFVRRLDTRHSAGEMPSPPIHTPLSSFIYVTSGKTLMTYRGNRVLIQTGECMVIPAGKEFSINYYDKCTGYMGAFHNGMVGDIEIRYAEKREIPAQRRNLISNLMDRIIEENTAKADDNVTGGCLRLFLTELNSLVRQSGTGGEGERNMLCDNFMNMVFDNFRKQMTIDEYAKTLGVSQSLLYKSVKLHTGRSPLDWIHEAMISEAKLQLSYTDIPIAEIASSLGLFDASYFTRFFGKHAGMTPSEYRNSTKKS